MNLYWGYNQGHQKDLGLEQGHIEVSHMPNAELRVIPTIWSPNQRRPQPQARGYQVHRRRPEGAAGQLNSLSTGRQPEAGCACGIWSLGGVANKANNPANAAEPVNTMMGN